MNTQDTVQGSINAIFNAVIFARKGHYVHALEVSDVLELETCIDSLYDEFASEYTDGQIFEFITTLQIYCIDDNNEEDVHGFSVSNYLNELMHGDNWSDEMHGY